MVTSVRETERKYEAPTGGALPPLSGLPGVAAEAGPEQQDLEAVYYDTEDLRLARAGITLRRRIGGDDAGWHLKLPAGEDTRQEIRLPLGRATKRPPKELASLVLVHTHGKELVPVAQIQTNRQRWQLVDGKGLLVAEVVEDLVTAQTMGRQTSTTAWREIEVELGEKGSRELLDIIEARLTEAGIVRSGSSAKLTRLLGDQLTESPQKPKLGKKSTAGDVVLAYVHEQSDAMKHYDPLVRRSEDDAVHQMRVATRRMRSALQSFGKVIERDRTRALTDELKWVAGVLGEARDLEVLRMRFEDAVHKLEPELVVGPVTARLTRHFSPLEASAHEKAVAALSSERYFALLDAIDALIAEPPLTDLAHQRATKVLPALIRKAYRRLAAHAEEALAASPSHERDIALHESRKAAKRLRYSTEVAVPIFGKPAEKYRSKAKAVQTLLGEHQDSVVARPVLRELAIEAHLESENGFTFGLLYGQECALAQRSEEEFPAVWRKVGKPDLS